DCRESIKIYNEIIPEKREEIKELKEDEKNGIQRRNRDNESLIKARYFMNFKHQLHNMRAHYSLGDPVNVLNEGFADAVQDLEKSEKECIDYLSLLCMVSLGILLETDNENIKRQSKIINNQQLNDLVVYYLLTSFNIKKKKKLNDFEVDYLLCACDIG